MLMRNEESKKMTVTGRRAYTRPSIVARGNIMDVTKGGGLLPGDVSLTLIDPGSSS